MPFRWMVWGNVSQPSKKVQPQLSGAHARLSVHVLGILNHVVGPSRDSATPNSLLRVIKLWYLMPHLRQRFASVESGT